jgi:hypothetical protein
LGLLAGLSGITSFGLLVTGMSIALPVWGMGAVSAPGKERGDCKLPQIRDIGHRNRRWTHGIKSRKALNPVRARAYRQPGDLANVR